MGIVCMYLAEILLKLTLELFAPVATNELLRERSPFSRAGHICQKTIKQLQTHSIPTYTAAKAYLGLSIKFSTYYRH